MSTRRSLLLGALVASAVTLASGAAVAAPPPGPAGNAPFTFAVIGDIPYGAAKIARFPKDVDQINADPDVQFVDHLGDIKDGSSVCSDQYFAQIKAQFDRFADPLVYTPGDNEWTDCHRTNNGAYNPLERLAAVRKVFFPQPGKTLGQKSVGVAADGPEFVENVSYERAGVGFAALHMVGSNDDLAPWTGIGKTAPTPEQVAENQRRTADVLRLIDRTFDQAAASKEKAVALLMQADMFDPTVPNPQPSDYSAFRPIVQRIADRSAAFGGPVYLFNGDSHVYNADRPLAPGSSWLAFYGARPAANLQRVTVDGSGNANDYLKVVVRPSDPAPLQWTRVPFTG
ncbi:metallophosphoesterase [Actinomycetospora chiangmaiensis]|uniref:metallophosphoesterase n=1 Tax=Actinomycetospora chiangmaiensis TaxID=402650 RepID=UPI0003640440|nr:metallophosphoesterase [Actinomycetospora chiangmaiensis]